MKTKLKLKKRLRIEDIDTSKMVETLDENLKTRIFSPPSNIDGTCYAVSNYNGSAFNKAKKGTVLAFWNRRGGKAHGLVYKLNYHGLGSDKADRYLLDLYGEVGFLRLRNPTYYNQILQAHNGNILGISCLSVDISNPENIIIYKHTPFRMSNKKKGLFIKHGLSWSQNEDQSVINYGKYVNGQSRGTWFKYIDYTQEGSKVIQENYYKTKGNVITGIIERKQWVHIPKTSRYFNRDNPEEKMEIPKVIVGKLKKETTEVA
jgi:hypothetical protein